VKRLFSASTVGNTSYGYGKKEEVDANRTKFFYEVGVDPQRVVFSRPTHGSMIRTVTAMDGGLSYSPMEYLSEADILIAHYPTVFPAFNAADCLVIGYFDRKKGVCALAHAGFKGVSLGVPVIALEALRTHGCNLSDIEILFSPSLLGENSLPGIGFDTKGWEGYWEPSKHDVRPYKVDFVGRAYDMLCAAGMPPANITQSAEDTYGNPKYISHAYSQLNGVPDGRFMVIAGWQE
jgi:copper oxidase (laccase) domain-containing protein